MSFFDKFDTKIMYFVSNNKSFEKQPMCHGKIYVYNVKSTENILLHLWQQIDQKFLLKLSLLSRAEIYYIVIFFSAKFSWNSLKKAKVSTMFG
jgi:hypothetical protein